MIATSTSIGDSHFGFKINSYKKPWGVQEGWLTFLKHPNSEAIHSFCVSNNLNILSHSWHFCVQNIAILCVEHYFFDLF
jgi:hypothetical protein